MKLANFLSDDAKKALSSFRKSQSMEICDNTDNVRKNSTERTSSRPHEGKQELIKYTIEDALAEIKQKRRERNIRMVKEKREEKRRKKRLRKLQQLKIAQEKEKEKRKRAIRKKIQNQKHEEEKRTQNRIRVGKSHHSFPIETFNSIKAVSIPMGGQNKQY